MSIKNVTDNTLLHLTKHLPDQSRPTDNTLLHHTKHLPNQSRPTDNTLLHHTKHLCDQSRPSVFIVNFEHISHFFSVSIVDFEQVIVC